ncbi:glutaminyl-peptide cyclotransferase-like [Salvia splendens]|uniref:glutaminyl-peptide cyclotransferase-like n=1 Tax=Salvia splendens TaxID=180675 RepID=UPI001C26E923|nr:glutaminyl-peptide cyclotransferase-like [Salvia splendens]
MIISEKNRREISKYLFQARYKSLGKKSVKRRPAIPNPTSLHRHRANYKMAALLISAAAFAYALIFLSISSNSLGLEPSIDLIYDVQVVNEFPHDPDAFTQGLLYAGNDALFESTGLYGHSSVRKVAIRTGKLLEITLKYKGDEVHNVDELEYVAGEVWANVWQTDCIARISGKDGLVLGWIYLPKLSGLMY